MKKTLTLLALLATIALDSCIINVTGDSGTGSASGGAAIAGSGRIVRETRAVAGFSRIALTGTGTVLVSKGDSEGLVVEADDNLLQYITATVSNGTLSIGFRSGASYDPSSPPKFTITAKTLSSLDISGQGTASLASADWGDLSLSLEGSGSIAAEGTACALSVYFSGSGDFKGGNLRAKTARISLAGACDAVAWATDSLDISLAGTGDVSYYGSPRVTQSISGLGTVTALGVK